MDYIKGVKENMKNEVLETMLGNKAIGVPKFNLQFFAEPKNDDDNDDDNLDDEVEEEEDDEPTPSVKTFTQEEVTRMLSKEKKQGKNAVYKLLGIDPKDTKTINMLKGIVEGQKTPEQKQNETETELAEANKRVFVAEAKAEAMLLGAGKQYVDDIVTLAMSKMEEDSDIKTVIGELKTKYPMWFDGATKDDDEEGEDTKPTKRMKGTGTSVVTKPSKKKDDGADSLGARLAAKRAKTNNTKSFWS